MNALCVEIMLVGIEKVMNEMRKLNMSADFFLQIHPMIFVGVQKQGMR